MLYALSGGDAGDETRRIAREGMAQFGRHPWLMMGESVNLPADADHSVATARYEELAARARTDYVQPAVLSMMAACIGRMDESAGWLRRAVEIRDSLILAMMAQFKDLRPVIARPEEQELLHRIKWTPPEQR